mmetsp:Transcript_84778/g.245114  ORF Transcript_84778/g.245114 Transcript_84778/m.245114 type:complete len:430 (-) Transcript_84778:211-1500(-)
MSLVRPGCFPVLVALCASLCRPVVAADPLLGMSARSLERVSRLAAVKALLEELGNPPKDPAREPLAPRVVDGMANRTKLSARRSGEVWEAEMRAQADRLLKLAGLSAKGKAAAMVAKPLFAVMHGQHQARGAWCGLNAASAVEYFSRAGIVIAASLQECAQQRLEVQEGDHLFDAVMAPCMADIAEIVSALMWAGTWLSLPISECADRASYESLCAGAIQSLVASIAETMAAGDVMRQTCAIPQKVPTYVAPMPVRRLQADNPAFNPDLAAFDAKADMSPEALDLEMAMCVQDAVQAATVLGQFGVAYDNSVFACPLSHASTYAENYCTVTVSLLLNRMLEAVGLIGAAVSHCGRAIGVRMGAACTGSVSQVVAGFAGLPATAAGMNTACPGAQASLIDHLGFLANPAIKISSLGRRLQEPNATAPLLV